ARPASCGEASRSAARPAGSAMPGAGAHRHGGEQRHRGGYGAGRPHYPASVSRRHLTSHHLASPRSAISDAARSSPITLRVHNRQFNGPGGTIPVIDDNVRVIYVSPTDDEYRAFHFPRLVPRNQG